MWMLSFNKVVKRCCLFVLLMGNLVALSAQTVMVVPQTYPIGLNVPKDSGLSTMLSTYKDSVTKVMGKVIGFSTYGMYKKQPESGLGNLMADATKTIAEQVYGQKVDAAFLNYGGIRSYLPKGDITVGNVFELMPFDNLLVIQKVRGDSLQQLLNHMANRKGWPISGITFVIDSNMAKKVVIGTKQLYADSIYSIANSDYTANGGDNVTMLKPFKPINNGYLLRDAIMNYIKMWTELGHPIDAKPEKRIIYANQ